MTISTLISMIIGVGIPLLVALITKEKLSPVIKALILLFFSTVTGVLTNLLGALPTTLSGWEHAVLNILMTYLAAAASYLATWKPSGTADAITKKTKGFGFG